MYTEIELIDAVAKSKSFGDTLSKLGRSRSGQSYYCLKVNIKQYEIDISHFHNDGKKYFNSKLSPIDILIFEPNRVLRRDTNQLVRALLESNVDHCCKECGLKDEWNHKKIVLEIDHINGDWRDNRILNLRFLCPNCHSQQKNSKNQKTSKCYCNCGNIKSRNSNLCKSCNIAKPRLSTRKVERPSLNQLQEDVDTLGFRGTGLKYGVSDNSVRKWIKKYKSLQ